jgi:predicted metal-binding membrane protein
MSMSGGEMMSMTWMPMCGESWLGAGASFLGMWTVMMTVMMLPSLLPSLWRYRKAVSGAGELPSALLTLPAAAGYFLVWALIGAAVYPAGAVVMAIVMRYPALLRAAPFATGAVVLSAGALQFTRWRSHHLARCRDDCRSESIACSRESLAKAHSSWGHGVRLGLHCAQCCAGLTAVLLVTGIMELPAMLAATAAITLERMAPAAARVPQLIGTVLLGAGLLLIGRASRFAG